MAKSREIIQTAIENLKSSNINPKFDCELCRDTLWIVVKDLGAKRCECLEKKVLAEKLRKIPKIYETAIVELLEPDISRHKKQAAAIRLIKENPLDSFGFVGKFGCGKTHLFWALYRYAAYAKRKVAADTLTGLLKDFKAKFDNPEHRVKISADDLNQDHTPFSIFLDDLDKAKPTEYAAEQLFELINAAQAWDHQIVWTSNLNADDLQEHFDRADKRFGGAIIRRLCDNSNYLEMF